MRKYTVKVNDDETKEWYINGKLHREDGPAIERSNGFNSWYINGKLHREDGPAIEQSNGYNSWYINGKLHREDGPAIEYVDGYKEWWIKGKELSEEQFKDRVRRTSFNYNGSIIVIDGVQYILNEVKKN